MPHNVGVSYSREEIRAEYQGDDDLPLYVVHQANQVRALRLRRHKNPMVSSARPQVWIGTGQQREFYGDLLTQPGLLVPLYVAESEHDDAYEFRGRYEISNRNHTPTELSQAATTVGQVLSRILFLVRARPAIDRGGDAEALTTLVIQDDQYRRDIWENGVEYLLAHIIDDVNRTFTDAVTWPPATQPQDFFPQPLCIAPRFEDNRQSDRLQIFFKLRAAQDVFDMPAFSHGLRAVLKRVQPAMSVQFLIDAERPGLPPKTYTYLFDPADLQAEGAPA